MFTCNKCGTALNDTNWAPSWRSVGRKECSACHQRHNNTSNPKHNNKRMYVNGKYIAKTHPLYKPGRYKTFNDAAFEGTYKLENIKEGYVYVITNKAFPGWVKIGMAIDAEDRLNGYQTSSPYRDYVLEHSVYTNNRRKAEKEAHKKAAKLCTDSNSEWFKLTVEQAINILDNLNVYGPRATKEANTNTQKDKLQERSAQADLWSYTQDKKAG